MKKLGFGLMRLPLTNADDPKSIDIEQVNNMVDAFIAGGFAYFDTAYMYHQYTSELAVRDSLVKRHDRSSFTLATKLPTMFLKRQGDMERIFDEQLAKCSVDYFDYYLLHCLTTANYEIAEKFGSFGFIQKKKDSGCVRHIGFSYHDKADLLDTILTEHPEVDFVQLQLNYIDWDNDSIQSRKCYEVARKHGKQVIVMEPVKGGSLAALPPSAEALMKAHSPDASVSSWAVRFAASHDGILVVLSGMSSIEQLLDNMSYMSSFKPLDKAELDIIGNVVDVLNGRFEIACTSCNYCVNECGKNIPIPKYFSLYNAEKQAQNKDFSIQQTYYNSYSHTHGKASDCVACHKCEKQCPQHLPISLLLKNVAKAFEGNG